MHRIWALIERDLRRFRRSPMLMMVSIMMPLVQLVVLGYAFGGRIRNIEVGVVDHDGGVPAVKLQEMFQAVEANARTFHTKPYADARAALEDLREGWLQGVVEIPPDFSRKVLAGMNPEVALIMDNTDQFSANTLEGVFNGITAAYRRPAVTARLSPQVKVAVVEVYPYAPYIQFMLPGTIVLSIFISAMIGGGIIYIDDKSRGLHEGYLVTPIRKVELVLGFNLAGAIKAVIGGVVLMTAGSLIAGIPDPFNAARLAKMFIVVIATALALISMMSLIMVRINDPLIPRAIFGILNTVLYFPSGAVYPTGAFPAWMRAISKVDPFTYGVHAFKELLLKNASMSAITFDLAFLLIFAFLCMFFATLLFKRTL